LEGKLLRDITGSVLVETSVVFPLFILLVLGTIDVAYMLSEWVLANKAAYIGARTAVVADAVASGITIPAYNSTLLGQLCFNPSTGASTGNCPTITATDCTGAARNGSCTNSYNWSDAAFTTYIFARMHAIYPRLKRTNVTVSYAPGTYTLGFDGQPNGLPMNVTVTITGMTHQFYFIGPIMNFFGGVFPNIAAIPPYATTLPSEGMNSANL
jgi:Flp pilus assembly protein TadG